MFIEKKTQQADLRLIRLINQENDIISVLYFEMFLNKPQSKHVLSALRLYIDDRNIKIIILR